MVKLVKLVTGEEVLAKVELEQQGGHYVLENPVKLALNQKGVAMIPLSPFMKEDVKFKIKDRDVIYAIDADDDVVNAYNGQFGGIIQAPPGLQLG